MSKGAKRKEPQNWTEVAEMVIAGKFSKADRSTAESITIGLKSSEGALNLKALKIMEAISSK